MFLRLHRRPLYIYFIDDETNSGKRELAFNRGEREMEFISFFFEGKDSSFRFYIIIYLENLLNSSKPITEITSRPSIESPYVEQDDERHERTGSVKFADQAEENKEVIFPIFFYY
jgi:hypothetical protein